MIKRLTELTIPRSIWLHGEGSDNSMLLRSRDNKQCCLGIFLAAAGVSRNELSCKVTPMALTATTKDRVATVYPWLIDSRYHSSDGGPDLPDVNTLMNTNDNECMLEEQREHHITEAFAAYGITVTFTD